MYNQVRDVLPEMAQWCFENNVAIIHFFRGASVSSYWTFNAQTLDRIQKGARNITRSDSAKTSSSLITNNKRIDVFDTVGAKWFVRQLEDVKTLFRRRFLYSPNELLYHEVVYEKLTGKFSHVYWKMLYNILGANVQQQTVNTLERIHPERCRDKIPNWNRFRSKIKNTDSYYACEMKQ